VNRKRERNKAFEVSPTHSGVLLQSAPRLAKLWVVWCQANHLWPLKQPWPTVLGNRRETFADFLITAPRVDRTMLYESHIFFSPRGGAIFFGCGTMRLLLVRHAENGVNMVIARLEVCPNTHAISHALLADVPRDDNSPSLHIQVD
jgi:hypothetical protein